MIVVVTQPNTRVASDGVRVYIDGTYIGTIGPGGSISGESKGDPRYPFEVKAVCGFYDAKYHGYADVRLNVNWSLDPPQMLLEKER